MRTRSSVSDSMWITEGMTKDVATVVRKVTEVMTKDVERAVVALDPCSEYGVFKTRRIPHSTNKLCNVGARYLLSVI